MKENQRKCFKCGRSRSADPTAKLYRFPRPGTRNTERCELWATYCFPDGYSSNIPEKLYSEHKMLCDRHFKPESFVDFTRKILHRSAVPADVKRIIVYPSAPSGTVKPSQPVLLDISNVTNEMEPQPGPSNICVTPNKEKIENPQPGPSNVHVTPFEVVPEKISEVPQPGPSNVYAHTENTKQRQLKTKCRRALQKVCQLRNQIKKLKNRTVLNTLTTNNAVNYLSKKLSPTMALFLQGEVNNFGRKGKGRRWSRDQKITALRLYKRSPTCYRLLSKLIVLPSQSSLKKLLQLFPLNVGINMRIFKSLKSFANKQGPHENEYILLFDEMSIRKNLQYNRKLDLIEGYQDHAQHGRTPQVASHALVFMICGIRKKLKQPVGFYLSGSSVTADRLAVLIKEVIFQCFKADIRVSAMVCDMDGVNRRALGILGATAQNPVVNIFGHKIMSLFDPPHLLKCFRNLLMKYNLKHSTDVSSLEERGIGIAKWSYIEKFYELDSKNPNFVFAPALRKEHLSPNTKQKMRVKLAAQVFSHSVAAGMFCKISQGELTAEATATANLVANIDKLFDCLNSNSPDLRRGKPHATNMSDKTQHIQIFRNMKRMFQSATLINCKNKPPSMDGWVWTLNSVELLWNEMKSRNPNLKSLSTRRLQQDPLENLFGCIRGHCGSNTNPTASQFVSGLKTAVLSRLASAGVTGSNCEQDANEAILQNLKDLLSKDKDINKRNEDCEHSQTDFTDYVPKDFDPKEICGEIQACAYVCGFILKLTDGCTQCKKYLHTEHLELEHMFVNIKEYDDLKRNLNYASTELIQSVELLATIINNYLSQNSYKENLKSNILEIVKTVNFSFMQCSTHKDHIVKSIIDHTTCICFKRFCTLKNRIFAEEASASALRKKINILSNK